MTVFKSSAERKTWVDVRCQRIGDRFNVERERTGFDPAWVQLDTGVELHKLSAWPKLAGNLHADWLAMAGHHGIDLQYVLSGEAAGNRSATASPTIDNVRPAISRGAGGAAAFDAWTAAHRAGIGQRLADELNRLQLDPTPWDYLSNRSVENLTKGSGTAADVRADFLSLLADWGVDCAYVLTGKRSSNWPAA